MSIIFLDLDNTIVGDVSPIINEWLIVKELSPSSMKAFRANVALYLERGILRPGFPNFISTIRYNFPNCPIYIYTASESAWANLLVGCIEQFCEHKFNRPIFTRNNCVEEKNAYYKAPHKLIQKIYPKLHQQFPEVSLQHWKTNYLMIDNYNFFHKNDLNRIVLCPSYNYTEIYDYLKNIPEKVLAEKYNTVAKILRRNGMEVASTSSFNKFKYAYYKALANKIRDNEKYITHNNSDTFWYDITDYMINTKYFGSLKGIQTINSLLRKHR